MANQEENKDLFRPQLLYREWGRRFTVLQQYLKGIHYYKKSTEYGDENFLWTLLGLSEALKKSGQFKEAAEAAEKCMEIDPSHMGAIWTRMGALYDIAEFCNSLVYAHKGARRRQHFQEPVQLGNETVQDCVGLNVPKDMLKRIQPWIVELEKHRNELLDRLNIEEDEFEGIEEEQSRFKVDDSEARKRVKRRRFDRMVTAMYLSSSAHDARFLDNLLQNSGLNNANKAGSAKLRSITTDCLTSLRTQRDALRTRKPLYAFRAQAKAAVSPGFECALWQELELRRCLVRNEAMFILRQLHETRIKKDYQVFFKMVERAKEKFESYNLRLFPQRQKYLNGLYRMVARAYMDPRNLLFIKDEAIRESYMRRLLGLRGGTLPRDSELAWPVTLNLRRAFETCRERLALASCRLEILWIFHEFCKLFLELRRYDFARFYAKKTRELSLESGYEDWALNASHILIRVELGQYNRNEAKEAANAALESARNLKVDFLVDFYERAVAYIDTLDFGHVNDDESIATRQRLIVSLMPDDLKPCMNLLIKTMEAIPARRRLSVMPGYKPKDRKVAIPCKRMTIKTEPPKTFEKEMRDGLLKKFAPSNKILGLINFEDYN